MFGKMQFALRMMCQVSGLLVRPVRVKQCRYTSYAGADLQVGACQQERRCSHRNTAYEDTGLVYYTVQF